MYHQNCYLAQASDVLTERWTLLIFRELLIQPCRFKDLNTWLAGMGTNLLAQRLKELEQQGMIEKQRPQEKRSPYQLTTKGRQVESVILPLIRWGGEFLTLEKGGKHFHHWDLLAMKAFFLVQNCRQNITVQFACDELMAWVALSAQELITPFTFALGETKNADIVLPLTISQFQQQIQAGEYQHDALLTEFINCFNH